jgi:hypothetical protein
MHSELDARVTIGPIEPWVATMPIYISLTSNHIAMQLSGSDSLQCNGVTIKGQPSDILGYHYEGSVPRVGVGGVYECVYSHAGARAVVRVPVQPGPTVISPKAGATLTRTGTLTITYEPGAGAGVSGEINQSQGLLGGVYSTYSGQPDTGTYTMPVSSGLKPGPGWIVLYRSWVIAPSGTGLKSVKVIDYSDTGIQVQWL